MEASWHLDRRPSVICNPRQLDGTRSLAALAWCTTWRVTRLRVHQHSEVEHGGLYPLSMTEGQDGDGLEMLYVRDEPSAAQAVRSERP